LDPTTTNVTPLAPSTQRSRSQSTSTSKPASWLEHYIGQQTAGAASALVLALDEARDGGITPRTRQQGAELIAEIVKLRNFLVGRFDFDSAARIHGARMLQEICREMSPALAAELVSEVLAIVARVVRAELN
jgi:hypothetical protein